MLDPADHFVIAWEQCSIDGSVDFLIGLDHFFKQRDQARVLVPLHDGVDDCLRSWMQSQRQGNNAAGTFTGAIMLTPLLNGCSKSVGPCLNGTEKLLSEDMKGQMLDPQVKVLKVRRAPPLSSAAPVR